MPDAVVQISAYKSLRRVHPRGAQGRLRRHVLQRVVRRHAGAGRRARQGGPRHRGQPGDAVPVQSTTTVDLARVPRRGAARPAATPSRTTRAWKATWRPRCSPKACSAPARNPTARSLIGGLESIQNARLRRLHASTSAPTGPRGVALRRPVDADRRRPRTRVRRLAAAECAAAFHGACEATASARPLSLTAGKLPGRKNANPRKSAHASALRRAHAHERGCYEGPSRSTLRAQGI